MNGDSNDEEEEEEEKPAPKKSERRREPEPQEEEEEEEWGEVKRRCEQMWKVFIEAEVHGCECASCAEVCSVSVGSCVHSVVCTIQWGCVMVRCDTCNG